MPNGRVHARIYRRWRFIAPLTTIASFIAWGDWLLSISVLPGYMLGAVVNPDMDLPRANTEAKQIWKRTIIFAWMVPWWNLYGHIAQRFLGGHRSFWTHMPGISTASRLLWTFFPFGIIWRLAMPGTLMNVLSTQLALSLILGIFIGLSLSDTVHAIADVIWR